MCMGCRQWCVFETVCGEFFMTGQSSLCTNLIGLCRQPWNQECDWGEGGESVWNDSELMGWGRQSRHQFIFRTLFLIHVGVSSYVQMWTSQKMPSRIAQSSFSAVPGGPGRACLLWGRWISERRKDSFLSLDLNCFSRGVRDVYWEGKLCLPRDRGLMGVCVGETRLLCPGWAAPLAQGNWERHVRSGPFKVLNSLPQQRL